MFRFQLIASVLLATIVALGMQPDAQAAQEAEMKSVLVTGSSTGIGRNLAETLAKNGYHVYAGARKDKDLAALNAIENITAVRLDVTKQDEIDALEATMKGDARKAADYGSLELSR